MPDERIISCPHCNEGVVVKAPPQQFETPAERRRYALLNAAALLYPTVRETLEKIMPGQTVQASAQLAMNLLAEIEKREKPWGHSLTRTTRYSKSRPSI